MGSDSNFVAAQATIQSGAHESKTKRMSDLDNILLENMPKSREASAVASLRPKRRWKVSVPVQPMITMDKPGPIVGIASRGPRMKKSGRAVQLWSTKPLHSHVPAAAKLPTRLKIQELVTQSIRDCLSFAHFSHSH